VYNFKGGAAFMAQDIGGQMPLFRARLMLEEGQADRALPVLEAFQPEDEKERQEKTYLLGWCYVSARRWDDAMSVLSPLPKFVEGDGGEESRPERVRLAHCLLRLGVAAVKLAQYEDASRHFTKCLKVLNDKKIQLPIAKLKARYGLAITYLMRGQYPAAIQHYELALGLCLHLDDDEERGNIYYGICDAYRRSGDLIKAQLACVKALELYERAAPRTKESQYMEGVAHNMLGLIYTTLGDYRTASDHYTEALAIATSHNGTRMAMVNCTALARVRLIEGRLEEARRYCRRALEIIERLPSSDPLLCGLTYLMCGKVAQAEAQRAEGEHQRSLLEEAITWFERAKSELSPTQAYTEVTEMYGLWAEVLEKLGRYEEALSCWKLGYEALSSANGTAL